MVIVSQYPLKAFVCVCVCVNDGLSRVWRKPEAVSLSSWKFFSGAEETHKIRTTEYPTLRLRASPNISLIRSSGSNSLAVRFYKQHFYPQSYQYANYLPN